MRGEVLQISHDPHEPLDTNIPPLKKRSTPFTQVEAEAIAPEEGLRTLLIYRAVLWAALMSTAADVSCLKGMES